MRNTSKRIQTLLEKEHSENPLSEGEWLSLFASVLKGALGRIEKGCGFTVGDQFFDGSVGFSLHALDI